MKKILIALFILVFSNSLAFAQDNKTPINFIYVHGSDQGTVEEFDVWMNRMHPDMKKNLEANTTVQKVLLKNASIKENPDMLYWADKTQKDKAIMEVGLKIADPISPAIAQGARSMVSHLLHDAIWLQRYTNMGPILNDLNNKVIANYKKGEKTVIVGYSAGTFITYQYLLTKERFLNVAEYYNKFKETLKLTPEEEKLFKKYAPANTCIDAIVDSKIGIMTVNGGLIANPNLQERRNNFMNLKKQTELSCAPENAISGVINFGSPISVFYSELSDEESQLCYFSRKMLLGLVETGKFFLTVNYNKDPLGIPVENVTFNTLKQRDEAKALKNGGGFRYDKMIPGGKNVIAAHLKYWDLTNSYTKSVAKSFEEGYNQFYGINNLEK